MAKRLTEEQKNELTSIFKQGINVEELSQRFNCTKLTIVRNLKKNLGEHKYEEIINNNKKLISETSQLENSRNTISDNDISPVSIPTISDFNNNETDFNATESFFEITPLDYEIENSPRKDLSSVPISEVQLPKIVYMVVDKKIELEIKSLKDFPEWEFLPSIDLKRKVIEIYFDLNIAKRSCKKDQKVIKVPNTEVFKIVAPILTSRGISRIVSAEQLIAL